MGNRDDRYDYLVIGGGFYGCCLALFLRSVSARVLLVEAQDVLMGRASRVNQARIHTGFHYPRSALTAVQSMVLHRRFISDFPDAVVADFQMLYAIARHRSKVSSLRFYRMFRDLGAPIREASAVQAALFDSRMVEGVFACQEAAFDYTVLQGQLMERIGQEGVELLLGTRVTTLAEQAGSVVAGLSDGREITAWLTFNITYSQINATLDLVGLPHASLKHELAEVALVEPPEQLAGIGITLMDGPFFSCMPYPTERLHSLTHVRYTPHESWVDGQPGEREPIAPAKLRPETHVRHMILDGSRYLPSLLEAKHVKSLHEVKTILQKNEHDDGRPILYQRLPPESRIVSILGAKIDKIYDLFELVQQTTPELAAASDDLVMGRPR